MIIDQRRYGGSGYGHLGADGGNIFTDILGVIPAIFGMGGTAPEQPPPPPPPQTSPLVYVALGIGGLAVAGGLYSVLKR